MVAEIEKVTEGLVHCTVQGYDCNTDRSCPYNPEKNGHDCIDALMKDALELLKELRPKVGEWVGEPDRLRHWHCSECGSVWGITAKLMYYCPNCGAKVEMPDDWRKDIEA